jgi:hypothetical protein
MPTAAFTGESACHIAFKAQTGPAERHILLDTPPDVCQFGAAVRQCRGHADARRQIPWAGSPQTTAIRH